MYDLLISVHGLGQRYDKIVVVNGAAAKLQKAIDNVAAAGIPFRFNCVLCTDALPDLLGVAKLAVAKGARAVNFIAFNPFIDQACGGKRSAENVPKYSDVVDYLIPAIDVLDANGIEVNVRYLPFCLFPEKYRKFVQNFQQIVYRPSRMGERGRSVVGRRAAAADAGAAQRADRFLPPHRSAPTQLLQERTGAAAGRSTVGIVGCGDARRARRSRETKRTAHRQPVRQRIGRQRHPRSRAVAAVAHARTSRSTRSSRPPSSGPPKRCMGCRGGRPKRSPRARRESC